MTTDNKLQQLFESTQPDERFLMQQKALSPLKPIGKDNIMHNIINPLTGLPYEGLILFGEFASIDDLNTNNRYYSAENYIEYVDLLKKEVMSPKGVYGEYEHPKGYPVNGNNVTHKILDLWYDNVSKKVWGYVMLLDVPKAKPALEIIKSGGQLGISARGGGAELKNSDGTFNAKLSLLITYDLVYHPGFTTSLVGYEPDFLHESNGKMVKKELKTNQQKQQQTMQQNQTKEKNELQEDLQDAVDKNLNESSKFLKNAKMYINNLK